MAKFFFIYSILYNLSFNREDLEDDDAFCFNVEFDDSDEVILGDGSDENHLHVCITSRKLMSNIESKGVHHIDGTYRITIYGFPLIVYGASDQCGKFHPICYMITSHEKQVDFEHFYRGLIELAEVLDLEFEPEFIMQDAQAASRSAALTFFPNVKILMCYFHLKKMLRIIVDI